MVMAKEPVAGKVKTRLCPPCSPTEAADVAEAALADTLEAVAGCNADRRILALAGRPGAWLPEGFEVIDQRGGDLASRLGNAWSDAGAPGFQIGMDTPQVSASMLDTALHHVGSRTGAILGRAPDGGWWGVGFQKSPGGVFDGVAMSRSDTADQQVARCEELGLAVHELTELRDVDTWEDALAVAGDAPDSRFAGLVRSITLAARGGLPR